MSTKTLWLLNSNGARAGKSVVSDHLCQEYGFLEAQCKAELHKDTMEFFDIPSWQYWYIYQGFKDTRVNFNMCIHKEECDKLVEVLKGEVPFEIGGFYYLTLRQGMIYVSECVMKPRHGKNHYGEARAESIINSPGTLFVDDSAAFVEEIPPAFDAIGKENVFLIKVLREGVNYEGDSRGELPEEMFQEGNVFTLVNKAPLKGATEQHRVEFQQEVDNLIKRMRK